MKGPISQYPWHIHEPVSISDKGMFLTLKVETCNHVSNYNNCMFDFLMKNKGKYTVNGLRLQANVASAVLTQIELECTCSV